MTKTKLIIILFAFLLIFNSCGPLQAINKEDFEKSMMEENYTIVDGLINMDPAAQEKIISVSIAISSDKSHQIEFFKLLNEEIATHMFNTNRNLFEKEKTEDSKIETKEKGLEYYKHTTKGKTYLISKIKDTIVYANIDEKHTKQVDKIIRKLGY